MMRRPSFLGRFTKGRKRQSDEPDAASELREASLRAQLRAEIAPDRSAHEALKADRQRLRTTVVLATFNGERYIREQLLSISHQSRSVDELVISDDGSTDATLDIVAEFRGTFSRFAVLEGAKHLGVVGNFERALRAAHGDVIILCDQDDIWEYNKVERVSEAFGANGLTTWSSDAALIDSDGRELGARLWPRYGVTTALADRVNTKVGFVALLELPALSGATMALRASVLDVALPLPRETGSDGNLLFLHDGWLAACGAAMGELALEPLPLVRYRQHGEQMIGANKSARPGERRNLGRWGAERCTHLADIAARSALFAEVITKRAPAAIDNSTAKRIEIYSHFAAARSTWVNRRSWRSLSNCVWRARYWFYANGIRSLAGDLIAASVLRHATSYTARHRN